MKKLQAFKFELVLNGEQVRYCHRTAGSCRFVFNKALAIQKENHEGKKPFISYVEMAKQLTKWRNSTETSWLKEAPCHPLQHALKDLDKAFRNFFEKRAAFPKFKRKARGDSFRYPDPKQIKLDQINNRIFLPKLGWIRYRNSRQVEGELRNVTVSNQGTKWFMSIQTQKEVADPTPKSSSAVGVDLGIARFATLSDGTYFSPLSSFKKHQHQLAKYQRRMSRKVKFSKNWKKARAKVQKVHTGIANARKDFLHKVTTTISKNHALVCIEDLRVSNMSKSAAGTMEQPGKMVRQKAGLNRNILDQGWGEFRSLLEYKMEWNGGMLLVVPPHNTSITCPCGYISKENRKTQALFKCIKCGYTNNADNVGANNVLERGYRLLACGEFVHVSRSKKQEPTEVSQPIS